MSLCSAREAFMGKNLGALQLLSSHNWLSSLEAFVCCLTILGSTEPIRIILEFLSRNSLRDIIISRCLNCITLGHIEPVMFTKKQLDERRKLVSKTHDQYQRSTAHTSGRARARVQQTIRSDTRKISGLAVQKVEVIMDGFVLPACLPPTLAKTRFLLDPRATNAPRGRKKWSNTKQTHRRESSRKNRTK
jgi:hypothetical protein